MTEEVSVAEYKRLLMREKREAKAKLNKEKRKNLRHAFETEWKRLGGWPLTPEHKFHPSRKWPFDYAYIPKKVAIELEGGTWVGGRHVRGAGYSRDCQKYNAAALLGWRVFRLTTDMIRDDPAGNLQPIIDLIKE